MPTQTAIQHAAACIQYARWRRQAMAALAPANEHYIEREPPDLPTATPADLAAACAERTEFIEQCAREWCTTPPQVRHAGKAVSTSYKDLIYAYLCEVGCPVTGEQIAEALAHIRLQRTRVKDVLLALYRAGLVKRRPIPVPRTRNSYLYYLEAE